MDDPIKKNILQFPINKQKDIEDYIYGLITIPTYYFNFIDSIIVQRLRNIRQIPTASYVFPSVNHSCFEHSIGTLHLSHKFIKELKDRESVLEIKPILINTVSLCGLFSNLGRVPYHESFVSFYKEKYNIEYDYKKKALELIDKLMTDKNIDNISNKNDDENFDIDILKNIFTKKSNKLKYYEKIVDDPKTLIDCNNFDCLGRDIYKYGFNPIFDPNVLLNHAYVINEDEISYSVEDAFSVMDYYNAKYTMYTKFYSHRVSTSIELMIKDIYKNLSNVIDFNNIINDNEKFIYFFDSFLQRIKNKEKSKEKYKNAIEILDRIDKRNLYTFVGEYYSSSKSTNNNYFDNFTVEKLIDSKKLDSILKPEEIRIKKDVINLGVGNVDPLENVSFYDGEKIVKKKSKEVSNLLTNKFEARIIRVYLTTNEKTKIEAAQAALYNLKKKNNDTGEVILHKSGQKERTNDQRKDFSDYSKELFGNKERKK